MDGHKKKQIELCDRSTRNININIIMRKELNNNQIILLEVGRLWLEFLFFKL